MNKSYNMNYYIFAFKEFNFRPFIIWQLLNFVSYIKILLPYPTHKENKIITYYNGKGNLERKNYLYVTIHNQVTAIFDKKLLDFYVYCFGTKYKQIHVSTITCYCKSLYCFYVY